MLNSSHRQTLEKLCLLYMGHIPPSRRNPQQVRDLVFHLYEDEPILAQQEWSHPDIPSFLKMYRMYEGFDFESLGKLRQGDKVWYYLRDSLTMTPQLERELACMEQSEPMFVEMIDGELVFS